MDFSFLRNWFTTNTSVGDVSSKLDNAEQSNSSLIGENIEKDDAFEIIEDYEFINPRDPNEIHSLPSSHQIDESIVEIAGFNKEKLLEMSNFCKISYGDDDNKLSERRCKTLAEEVYKTGFEVTTEGYEIIPSPEKMYKTRAELTKEGYEIISFSNSFEEDAGHVFIKAQTDKICQKIKKLFILYFLNIISHGSASAVIAEIDNGALSARVKAWFWVERSNHWWSLIMTTPRRRLYNLTVPS